MLRTRVLSPEYLMPSQDDYLSPRTDVIPDSFPILDAEYNMAYTFLVVTMIFQILAVLVFFARVYTRAYPTWRFTIDDYVMTLAFVCCQISHHFLSCHSLEKTGRQLTSQSRRL